MVLGADTAPFRYAVLPNHGQVRAAAINASIVDVLAAVCTDNTEVGFQTQAGPRCLMLDRRHSQRLAFFSMFYFL